MPNPREYGQPDIDRMREAVARLGNRSAAALELDLPRTTIVRYTRDLMGSPSGGGFNPVHADRHPERDMKDARAGREPIAVAPMGRPPIVVDRAKVEASQAPPEPVEPPAPPPRAIDWEEKGDAASVSFTSDRLVRTEADAVEFSGVDLSVWYVKSWKCGGWTTTMRLRAGQDEDKRWKPDSGHVKQNWKVHLELARIFPKPIQAAHEAIFAKLARQAPFYEPARYSRPTRPHLLEVDLFDVHFGKLAWGRETGEDYDLKIAARIFDHAVEDILSRACGHEIDRIVLPVGQDYFNIDGISNATTAGTPQDTDGRFEKIVEVGELSMIRAVERLRGIAPVKVLYVPGNHDRISAWHLCRTLWARFYNCSDVEVDFEPTPRKYFAYHRTLLGFVHGNEEKLASLPIIMATECPEMWAASERREIHTGHWHQSKRTETTPVATHNGVKVRSLQSLSGRDAWHARRGYVGGTRAAEAFLFDSVTGDVTGIEVSIRRAS